MPATLGFEFSGARDRRRIKESNAAVETLKRVLQAHSYARARVQLGALYLANGQPDLARAELKEVLADDATTPDFQRKRERVWIRRAKRLLRSLGKS